MSLQPGFDVMDIDVAIANDPKFRRIQRIDQDHVLPAFMAYVAVLGESWKAAERVTIEDAWPALLTFDSAVVESMKTAELIDRTGRIPVRAWRKRFTEANQRRVKARERWKRYNDKRSQRNTNDDDPATTVPRGNARSTATSVRSVPSVPFRPSDPSESLSDATAPNGIDMELWTRVQRLAEELTGRPHALANPYGGYGHQALGQATGVPWSTFEAAWRQVASVYGQPTARQLVFDGEDVLQPTGRAKPAPMSKADRETAEARAQLKAAAGPPR